MTTPANLTPEQRRDVQRDGLVNIASGLGTSQSKRSHNRFVYGTFNDWMHLDAAYQSNWIAQKIVDAPVEDATREWRRIKCDGSEDVVALENQFDVQGKVTEALTWARLYGGAGVVMITDQDLEKPLNVNAIKKGSLQQLIVFDRWDLTSASVLNMDILSPNYLKPEWYTLRNGSQRIHWTHIARFSGKKLPRRHMEKTQGWGDSTLRKCIEDVMDTVAAKDGIAELMQEANVDVIKSEGLAEDIASDQDDKVIKRYQMFSQMKSIINMALLDGTETMERQTLNLSGVAPIIEQFMTWISAAADIPVTRMFGTSAKGMNATGEGDNTNYNNSVKSIQTQAITEPLRTLDEVIVRSALGHWPNDFSYVWNPLEQPNTLEIAQSNHLNAQRHQMYLADNIVTRSQVMRELQSSEEYQFDEKLLDELEEMESENLFEEVPNPEDVEPPAPTQEQTLNDADFVKHYTTMFEAGATHDEIMSLIA